MVLRKNQICNLVVQMGLQFRFQQNGQIAIAMSFRFGIEENTSFFTGCCVGLIQYNNQFWQVA